MIAVPDPVVAFKVVALAASAGGLDALSLVLAALPADFAAAIVIVQHLSPGRPSFLSQILGRRTPLAVCEAHEGDRLSPGTVFLAPPDRHLLVNPDASLSLSDGPKEHFVRPSASRLFSSLAASLGPRAIAVVLTGTDGDGASALRAVKVGGGTVMAQDEASSAFFGMPRRAIETGQVDLVLPLAHIAPALLRLVGAGARP